MDLITNVREYSKSQSLYQFQNPSKTSLGFRWTPTYEDPVDSGASDIWDLYDLSKLLTMVLLRRSFTLWLWEARPWVDGKTTYTVLRGDRILHAIHWLRNDKLVMISPETDLHLKKFSEFPQWAKNRVEDLTVVTHLFAYEPTNRRDAWSTWTLKQDAVLRDQVQTVVQGL